MFFELQTYLSFSSSSLFFKCLAFSASASFSWAFSRSFSVLISTALATISATCKDLEMTTFSINPYWSMLIHHLRHHFRKLFLSFFKSIILTPFSLLPPSSFSGLLPWRALWSFIYITTQRANSLKTSNYPAGPVCSPVFCRSPPSPLCQAWLSLLLSPDTCSTGISKWV